MPICCPAADSMVTRPSAPVYFMALSTRLICHALQAFAISLNAERFYRAEPKFYAMGVRQRLESEVNLFEHLCQVYLLPVHSQYAGFGAGQEQESFHQVSDPVDLFQGALEGCAVFLRCSCRTQNNLQFTFQNGEGSLKFMGGIGTEPADLAECSIQTV